MQLSRTDGFPLHALLLSCALAGCGDERGEAPRQAADPVVVGAEDVAVVDREPIRTGPRISGSLEPLREAVVRAETGGSVVSIDAELGQRVEEGAVLAEIEGEALADAVRSAEAAVEAARHRLAVARRELERTERLVRLGALPARDLDTAESAVSLAEAELEEAEARLASAREQFGRATVRSPIAGVVAERAVSEGDVVSAGAPLFTVIDPSSMRLEASVPSDALSALSEGAPVTFTVRGYPDQRFVGRITWIAPAADPETRQVPILVDIPNEEGRLIARLFAEGRIVSEAEEGLVVPEEAVDRAGPTPTVAVVRGGRVERVAVSLGLRDEITERVEIEEGLREGDVVLVRGGEDLPEGTPVELPASVTKPAEAAAPAAAKP